MSAALKTRIAPTPSGFLHLGNAFSFITTALIAHLEQASLLLRIDDLDQARYRQEYADDIFTSLRLLDIAWDEGPADVHDLEQNWSQRYRQDDYSQAIQNLLDTQQVFACDCSRKDIAAAGESSGYPGTCLGKGLDPYGEHIVLRMLTSGNPQPMRNWRQSEKSYHSLPDDMHHFILRRRDGLPSYQLASVMDDLQFGVNLVVRGEDLFSSTIAQLLLAKALGAESFRETTFFHHQLLRADTGEKLSKSVLQHEKQLLRDMDRSEIFMGYSRFLGLPKDYASLDELKQEVTSGELLKIRMKD